MNRALGQSAVLIGLLSCVFAAVTLAYALTQGRRHLINVARRYSFFVMGASMLAAFAMERALFMNDFSLKYVAEHGSRTTPTLFKFTTMWSALEGSILLWSVILSIYTIAVAFKFRNREDDPLFGWAMFTMFLVGAFFFGLMVGPANPFHATPGAIPLDGPGPNPLLQNHILVAFHPPILYAGYVGFTVPFAFCVGALVTGRLGDEWLREVRVWSLVAWTFLSVGIVLGAWWSYEVLGWGGYWAWDPVENASFIPWLTATAFLHSSVVQERRGMLRVWNASLVIATFALTILGTFLTRSGVLDSVHAFSESSIGAWLIAFFGLVVVVGVGLIYWRGDSLRTEGVIDSPWSREGVFLINNVLFAAFAFIVLLGTTFPLFVEAINNDRLSVGRPYFDRMTMPIALAILFFMAVAPLLPWRATNRQIFAERAAKPALFATVVLVVCVVFGVRGFAPLVAFSLAAFAGAAAVQQIVMRAKRHGIFRAISGRSGGGMVVHIAVVIIAVAFAASQSYSTRKEVRINVGDTVKVSGHSVTLVSKQEVKYPNRTALVSTLRIDNKFDLKPAITNFRFATQSVGTPSVRPGYSRDVYTTMVASTKDGAIIGVLVLPMVSWIWWGAFLLLAGCLLAMVPDKSRKKSSPIDVTDANDDRIEALV